MKTLKSGLVILAVIAFLAGAYFMTAPKKQAAISDEKSSNIKLSSLESAYSVAEKSSEENNLTKTLGQNLFENIKKQTETNPDFFSSLPDINTISQKIIGDSLKDNQFLLGQTINEADLKISPDNSKEAQIEYISAVIEISQNRMTGFDKNYQNVLADVVEKNDLSSANYFADIQKNIADDYLKLVIPSSLLSIHKKLIIHFKNSELIFRAIADYPNDSIKAYLAVQAIDQLETNVQEIQVSLYQKAKEIGI